MNFKRILSILATAALLNASVSPVFPADTAGSVKASAETAAPAVSFTDTDGHWAHDAIDRWASLGVVVGENGVFRPDDALTRAELAVILQRVMRYETVSEEAFDDLTEDWYTDAILKLRAAGVMRGDEANRALPGAPVTREEASVLIARAFAMDPSGSALPFPDAASISDWAKGYIAAMTESGFLHGSDGGCFLPADPLTRAEAVTILNNMVTACFYEAGDYDYRPFEGLADFVIVAANDVNVLNFDIGGNILLAEGVDPESVRLKAVNHYGKILQYTPDGYVRWLKAASYIVPINEHLPVCSHDPELFRLDERGIMTYDDGEIPTYFGVDVSSWQGDVDWETLREEGVYFAFIRAGYRGYESGALNEDKKFRDNIEGAIRAGIKVGVYFFSQALDADEAYEEANFVLEMIRGYDVSFPVVFDWETVSSATARTKNIETEKLCEAANVFCNTVAEAGYIPMVYCNQNVSLLYYELSRIQAYDFWYAEYKSKPTFYYDFDIWQYGATGHLKGVPNADVDVNISFVDYSQKKPQN